MIYFGSKERPVFAKVWSTDDKGNYVKTQISTSKKKKDGSGYENSSWFGSFVGSACVDKARDLEEKATIKITSGSISTSKGTDGKSYTNVAIFDFDFGDVDNEPAPKKKATKKQAEVDDDSDNEDLPF
jgi:hypothetical protein